MEITNIQQRRILFGSGRNLNLRFKNKTLVYIHILCSLLLHHTTSLFKQLKKEMVCVMGEHVTKVLEEETSHEFFLFILKQLLYLYNEKVQNGIINIYQVSRGLFTKGKNRRLYVHTAYSRTLSAHLQGIERKQLPLWNRTIKKFVQRRKMYKNICLSKESDIVNGRQTISLCISPLLTFTEDLKRKMNIGPISIDIDSIGQSNARPPALDRLETQIRITLKRPQAGTHTNEKYRHSEEREQLLKHDRTLHQTKYLSMVCQAEILSKNITEIFTTETFSLKSEKKGSYLWDINAIQNIHVFPVQQYSLEQAFTLFGEGGSTITNPEVFFSNYLTRLSSYHKLQSERAPSAIKLSKAGFYSTGNKDETVCFHCGCRYSSWCPSENPIQIHKEISPGCEFIQEIFASESCNGTTTSSPVTEGTPCSEDTDTLSRQHLTGNSLVVYGNEQNHFRDNNPHEDSSPIDRRASLSIANSTGDFQQRNHVFNYHNDYQHTYQGETKPNTSLSNVFESISLDNTPSTASLAVPPSSTLPSSNCSTELTLSNGNSDWQVKGKDSDTNDTTSAHGPGKQPKENKQELVHPLFPNYLSLPVRMSSFAKWPTHLIQTAKQMATAGFFYKGYADVVVCFWCGVTIFRWEDEDEPCIEHVKWQPLCPFTIQTKGQDFVNLVLEEQRRSLTEKENIDDYNVAEQTLTRNDATKVRNYAKLKEMGFEQEQINNAAHKISRLRENPTDEEILEQLLNDGTQGETNETIPNAEVVQDQVSMYSTPRYNYASALNNTDDTDDLRRLERLICKICMAQEVKVTFLPCGHLICCMECSGMVSKCPVCRARIEHRVKSYIS